MSHVKYRSGSFTLATPVSALRNESPLLPELNDILIFHQDFMQLGQNFVAQDYNTPNPDLVTPAYLFDESPREDIGGGVVKWTRSWVRIPSSYGKAGGVYPYIFPGFADGRNPFQMPVAMQITRDFFLCGNFGMFASWQNIPIIKAFQIYKDGDPTQILTPQIGDSSNYILDDTTTPTLADYQAMIAAGTPLQVEDSKVTNFRGGVYMRERFTVIAQ
jgi:hypothetical protein